MPDDIQSATPQDLPEIARLKVAMFEENGHGHWLHDDIQALVVADYAQLYQRGDAVHCITRQHGTITAMAGAFMKSDLPYRYFRESRYGFIGDVYTLPAYRHRGLSSALVDAALDWLQTQPIEKVRLLASDYGRAIYERIGFEPSAEMVLELAERRRLSGR
ncbi:GNAT family N-acetyltransferase [Salinisphaera sp. SPP-AMP-43]|uniref:GNAT family N-acetyltransferase n=1 Tax=Salinisphaera sp. SPP-AMP-43 TaxID=3121288 RepID=UPI003C6DC6EA